MMKNEMKMKRKKKKKQIKGRCKGRTGMNKTAYPWNLKHNYFALQNESYVN